MTAIGWLILTLVFLDEVVAVAVFAVWGYAQDPWWIWVWLLPLAAAQAWYWFASPKVRYGGPLLRPVVKVIVFGLACLALWDLDHPTEAVAFLVYSIAVNGLAQLPFVAALPGAGERRED